MHVLYSTQNKNTTVQGTANNSEKEAGRFDDSVLQKNIM
jgi:hypothetical protein